MAEEKKAVKPKKASTAKTETKPKATVKKAPAVKKATAKPAAKKTKAVSISPEHRYRMIEVAAYYLAEKDGFAGNPLDYWIAAEGQISK